MLQVLGRADSINVRKVLWLCDELGLAVDHQPWGGSLRSTRTAEFLALNPNALVPVIRDGAFVLWESNAILRYLAAEHGRVDLLPSAPRERALVEQWMDWQLGDLNSAWRYAFMALVRRDPAYIDPAAIESGIAGWNRHMTILDDRLRTTGAYAAGATFTLADIVLGLSTNRWLMAPIERPALAAVMAYHERLGERPAFRRHGRNGLP